MKKRVVIPSILLLLVIAFIFYRSSKPTAEEQITSIVESHESELKELSIQQLNGDFSSTSFDNIKVDGVYTNEDGESIVQFFYSGLGIAPAGKYYGFYYSPNDIPVAFQNTDYKLEKDNGIWKWSEGNSDNGGFTKRISECWYYYEAWF